jgi:disulfide bond formation protein DsbB
MSVLAVSTFLALLALAAFFGVLVTFTFMAIDRIGLVPGVMAGLRAAVRPIALWLAFAVAATSMAGSLYLSEVAGFVPCALCWFQRIAMYPLVLILGIAAVRGDPGVTRYAAPVAFVGALISIWHIGVERLPGLPSGACSLEAPCDLIYIERFGFVTIPTMALFGFLAILTLLLVYARRGTEPELELESAA